MDKQVNINDKQKRILFNGRTLNNNFRRGLWTKSQFDNFNGQKPVLSFDDNYKAFLWYNGTTAFYVSNDNKIHINDNFANDMDILNIVSFIRQINNITSENIVENLGRKKVNRESDIFSRCIF